MYREPVPRTEPIGKMAPILTGKEAIIVGVDFGTTYSGVAWVGIFVYQNTARI